MIFGNVQFTLGDGTVILYYIHHILISTIIHTTMVMREPCLYENYGNLCASKKVKFVNLFFKTLVCHKDAIVER